MEHLPMRMTGLTPQMVKIAEEELGETEDVRVQALKDFRRLINAEDDFRPMRDDAFLLRFLRCKKFDVEKAFKTLMNHYTFKVRFSGRVTDFKPSQFKKILESNIMFPLPKRLRDGSSVAVLRIGHYNLNDGSANDLLAICLMSMELGLELEASQVCGVTGMLDFHNFGLRHMKHLASPSILFNLVRLVQDCTPIRLKAIHMVNEPFYFSVMFNVIKHLLSEKIKNRIHIHGRNLQSLHKFISPENLPEELGGTLGPADNTEFRQQLLEREAQFEKMNKHGFTEKKAKFIRKKSSRSFGLLF